MAGGKGASLARMTRSGLPVPEGFVIVAGALGIALDSGGRRLEVAALLESDRSEGQVAAAVREIVLALGQPKGLEAEIVAAMRHLGPETPVAVRSSASAEDSKAASFAGQHETHLNVLGAASVWQRVRECWASFFSERALFYRARKASLSDLAMAVVVQRQLQPEKAGVMFTIDPVRRRRDQLIVEAVWGLGEPLLSGAVTPDHYVVARDGKVKQARVAVQPVAILPLPGGGTSEEPLEPDRGASRVLDEAELAELAALGNRLQEYFGAPQDVEWAYQQGKLYVLQSRPVTA